jgi:hypothetical protein
MRRRMLAVALCLLPLPAVAQNLQGQWTSTASYLSGHNGILLIDAERRVTWDIHGEKGTTPWIGYVARNDASAVDIPFTTKINNHVFHLHCTIQSSDLMHCLLNDDPGSLTIMTRVGPGPRTLLRVSP